MTFKELKQKADYIAPDGSEIRLLINGVNGGLCHCTLPASKISKAVKHKTVEEIWYCISGKGEIWRKKDDQEDITNLESGDQ
jgi:mannose-6-phosphate isomerase-like protein (cupin superfamily)